MPCGGIIVCVDGPGKITDVLSPGVGGCWVCCHGGCRHFLIEWDTYIHARCAVKMMAADDDDRNEVIMVIFHKHTVTLDFSLEEAP